MQISLVSYSHPWCWITANANALASVAACVGATAAIAAGIFAAKAYSTALRQVRFAQTQADAAEAQVQLLREQNSHTLRQMEIAVQPTLVLTYVMERNGQEFAIRNVGRGPAESISYEHATGQDFRNLIKQHRTQRLTYAVSTNFLAAGDQQIIEGLDPSNLYEFLMVFRYESVDGRVFVTSVRLNNKHQLVHHHERGVPIE